MNETNPPAPNEINPQETDSDLLRRQELYDKHADQSRADKQSSSDEYDKNLLTFSSGALGLSLAFIKDIVPLREAVSINWLFASWAAFVGCIVVTIASYIFGIKAQDKHLEYLYEYYFNKKAEFCNKKNAWSWWVSACAVLGAILFLSGLVATVGFAYKNIKQINGVPAMTDNSKSGKNNGIPCVATDAHPVSQMTRVTDARIPSAMTPLMGSGDVVKARVPSSMTPVATQQVQPVQPVQSSQTQQPNNNTQSSGKSENK